VGRKKKIAKQTINILRNGENVPVTMTPPTGSRKSWYAYWKDLTTSKSTGCSDFAQACKAVQALIVPEDHGTQRTAGVLTDDEFIKLQIAHYDKKSEPKNRERARKSCTVCLEAISAFQEIMKLEHLSLATPEDCESFQRKALELPANWRRLKNLTPSLKTEKGVSDGNDVALLSPSTVTKWSKSLRAAFNRANRNAGQKCVRGIVANELLLTENPWDQFTWIESRKRRKRFFTEEELISLLDYFETNWPGAAFTTAYIKTSFWSGCRKSEVCSLRWEDLKSFGQEIHFESNGKHDVTKWFRIPQNLYHELLSLKTDSPYVFACYPEEMKKAFSQGKQKRYAKQIRNDYNPENLGEWMYRQIVRWAKESGYEHAYLHTFRKTTLQFAYSGEHAQQAVAQDASVTSGVMMGNYASEGDDVFRFRSNATFERIKKMLDSETAIRFGVDVSRMAKLHEQLEMARSQSDWSRVSKIAQQLGELQEENQAASRLIL
tara:strand:- start:81 stop:1553 length:1473 start_codon:yes stop_codon:yes gene_type:complete